LRCEVAHKLSASYARAIGRGMHCPESYDNKDGSEDESYKSHNFLDSVIATADTSGTGTHAGTFTKEIDRRIDRRIAQGFALIAVVVKPRRRSPAASTRRQPPNGSVYLTSVYWIKEWM